MISQNSRVAKLALGTWTKLLEQTVSLSLEGMGGAKLKNFPS